MRALVYIKGMPDIKKNEIKNRHIVSRLVNGELQYYGAYRNRERAELVAKEINGCFCTLQEWEGDDNDD